MDYKEYRFPLKGAGFSNLQAIREIIESNASSFDNYLLTNYGGDAQFSVSDGSFEVTDIGDGAFSFTAEIDYFAGCRDMSYQDDIQGTVEYEISDGDIVIILNETVWDVR